MQHKYAAGIYAFRPFSVKCRRGRLSGRGGILYREIQADRRGAYACSLQACTIW